MAIDQSKNQSSPDQSLSERELRLTPEEFRREQDAMWEGAHAYETLFVEGEDGLLHPVCGPRKAGK